MFAPLAPSKTRSQASAEAIRQAILSRKLRPGSKLPPERELAEELGVNRTTLRAALGELTAQGLLDVRQGAGYQINDYRTHAGPELCGAIVAQLRELGEGTQALADLLAIRKTLAGLVLSRLEARGLSAEHQTSIGAAIQSFAVLAEGGFASPLELAQADLEVLRAIVLATDSSIFCLFVNPIAQVLLATPELCNAMYAAPQENVLAYRALLSMLVSGGAVAEFVADVFTQRDAETLRHLSRKNKRGSK